MREIKYFINQVINQFIKISSTKSYEKFLKYLYDTIDTKINQIEDKKMKNKYIKIRESILEYVVVNKKAITLELCKRKKIK
jgi:hypothetical protein